MTNLADRLAGFDQGGTASESGQACGLPSANRRRRTPKRKRRGSSSPTTVLRKTGKRVNRRRHLFKSGYDSESEDELEGGETETQLIKVSELHSHYYAHAFRAINQLACKDIGKSWIRIAQPKKQTTHPYNGGRCGADKRKSIAEHGYLGHFTMPDYWPSDAGWQQGLGCRHREPDHVKKPGQYVCELVSTPVLIYHLERLILLVHLLRSQGKGFEDGDFSLKKMKQSTDRIHLECESEKGHWKPEYVERLEDIYRMREKEIEYEQGQCGEFRSSWRRISRCANPASDGDTLVSVEMPKPRCKSRKAPKLAAKAVIPPSEQVKQEAEERNSSACKAPIANMVVTAQTEEEEADPSEGCEPSMHSDSYSSTEEGASDGSCYEPNRAHNSVLGSWFQRSANLRQDPTIFTRPDSFGSFATSGEIHRALPFRDQYRPGSSSTQLFPNQGFERRQNGHESANWMRPNGISTHSPPSRPIAPKMENVCHQTFAASSSGVAGYFHPDADYTSWQTQNLWDAQIEPSTNTAVADPSISFLPATNGYFGSDYSGAGFSFGLQPDAWNGGNQALVPPNHDGLDEDLQQSLSLQAVNAPQYQTSSMSGGNPDRANQFLYTTDFSPYAQAGTEHEFDPFAQHQRQH